MKSSTFLTKSRYVNGLQCAKWIWLSFNRPQDLPEVDDAAQRNEHLLNKREISFT